MLTNIAPPERPDSICEVADVRSYSGCDMPHSETIDFAGGIAVVYSSRSPEKATANEDAAALIAIDERTGVLAVADGLGGQRGGELASRLSIERLIASLRESVQPPSFGESPDSAHHSVAIRMAILNGIESTNQELLSNRIGSATTVAAVEIQGHTVRPYHVGDSAILVTGQRSKIKLQTVAHSPVGFAVEAGVLDSTDAMHHEDRHLISNCVGSPEMRIEIGSPLKLAPRDTLLLASDGLFDNLHLHEIVEEIRIGTLGASIDQLAAECRRRMTQPTGDHPSKPDDLTIIAFRRRAKKQRRRKSTAVPRNGHPTGLSATPADAAGLKMPDA